jgi:hypothetical protein
VSKVEAESILGRPLDQPVEALQGPTCIFKSTNGTIAATIAVETVPLARFRSGMKGVHVESVAKHQTFCGTFGSPTLVSQLDRGALLVVSAPCPVAQRLAAHALPRVPAVS